MQDPEEFTERQPDHSRIDPMNRMPQPDLESPKERASRLRKEASANGDGTTDLDRFMSFLPN